MEAIVEQIENVKLNINDSVQMFIEKSGIAEREAKTLRRLIQSDVDEFERVVAGWYNEMRETLIYGLNRLIKKKSYKKFIELEKASAGKIVAELAGWECIKIMGMQEILPAEIRFMQRSGNKMIQFGNLKMSFEVVNTPAVKFAEKSCANLVTEILDDTKSTLRTYISRGIKEGKDIAQLGREIKGRVGLHSRQWKAVDNYGNKLISEGISGKKYEQMIDRYTNKLHRYRTEMIARTETARAYAEGTLQSYKANKVKRVQLRNSVRPCPICQALNMQEYTLESARGVIPLHPHCFQSGVIVYTIKGWKKIEDVKVNDLVYTHKSRFRKVIQLHKYKNVNTSMVSLFIDKKFNYELTLSANHKIMLNGKWQEADKAELKGELSCLSFNNGFKVYEIKAIKRYKIEEEIDLYNLSVEEDESYVAKGFLVHNCMCYWTPVYDKDTLTKPTGKPKFQAPPKGKKKT